jgi:hypothetical protein
MTYYNGSAVANGHIVDGHGNAEFADFRPCLNTSCLQIAAV